MTFEEWWAAQPKDPTKPITPRMVWDAATQAEREACAAMIERTDLSGAPNEMKGWLARMILAYADAIRARSNDQAQAIAEADEGRVRHGAQRRMKWFCF